MLVTGGGAVFAAAESCVLVCLWFVCWGALLGVYFMYRYVLGSTDGLWVL